MATFTASQISANVRNLHTGVQVAGGHISLCGTATASSVFLLAKVPNHCTIVDFIFYGSTGGANGEIKIGTSNSESALAANFSYSASASSEVSPLHHRGLNTKLPVRISLSDDAGDFVWLQAIVSVDISASAIMRATFFYVCDGTSGTTTVR